MAKITIREAISQALMEEMDRDPAVFIMGEEVGVWGGTYAVTKGFYDKYGPDRVKDTPIAENAIIGGAIGAAMVGQRPIAELMTINFAFLALDAIVNTAATLRRQSTPRCCQKRWSSVAISASTTCGGMLSSASHSRFDRLNVASTEPSAASSTLGRSLRALSTLSTAGVKGISSRA